MLSEEAMSVKNGRKGGGSNGTSVMMDFAEEDGKVREGGKGGEEGGRGEGERLSRLGTKVYWEQVYAKPKP